MTRNQKLALGCGGAGCLGLIVVVIAGCLIYFFNARRTYRAGRDYTFNVNLNSNLNSNRDTNYNSNNANSNSNSNSSAVTSLSDDDKHKLFHAATVTGDSELINRVNVRIGILNEDFTPGQEYDKFMGDHIGWGMRNIAFIQSINTAEKARAYVNEHFPE